MRLPTHERRHDAAARACRRVLKKKVQVLVYRHAPELQVLLLKRARPSREGAEDDWHPVTGNVDPHEQLRTAAIRECWEEISCEVDPQPLGMTFTYEKKGKRFHETIYAASVPADEEIELSEEHTAHAWLAVDEAMARLHFPEQRKALDALASRAR
jgi:8-oxo-dGTP pyrophosphatase MutT (NUDIX family)